MILDKEAMIADALAHDGTTTELDTQSVGSGPGQPIKMFISGSATLAGCTGFTISDGAVTETLTLKKTNVATLAGKLVEFELDSDILRFVGIELVGTTSAGTWTCGVVLPGNQTAV